MFRQSETKFSDFRNGGAVAGGGEAATARRLVLMFVFT
jgi:hypothetical protein